MKSIKYIALAAIVGTAAVFQACSSVEYPDTPSVPGVTNLAYTLSGRNVTLTWDAPAGATGFEVIRNAQIIETLPAGTTTCTLQRQSTGVELAYTVKAMYDNDLVSLGETVRFIIEAIPAKVGMLIPCSSVDELTDDDEIAAAEWFSTTYASNGSILTPADIAGLDPDEYNVVWVNVDRVGLAYGWENLPAPLVTPEAVEAMARYVAEGGNVFLTKMATQLTVPYGIIAPEYAPGIFGSGDGGEGNDNWCVNAQIGYMNHESDPSQFYDHRGDDIYKGMTVLPDYGHETFALEGPGWREDHNCMWDLNAYQYTAEGANTVEKFQNQNHCVVLGTWAHVVDYAVAGIVQFNPTADRRGSCIAIGLSAYEFAQRGGNPYQDNVNRLTQNCMTVLSK